MNPLLGSRNMSLQQLPETIYLPAELDAAINALTTKGLQQNPSVEANAVICFDGVFSLKNKALGARNASTTDHKGVNGVGAYHSHPLNTIIDAGDFMMMFESDRGTENFSLVDGSAGKRSALFKTADSPTTLTDKVRRSLREQSAIVELARCASMGYYEGRGILLYRVYPKS